MLYVKLFHLQDQQRVNDKFRGASAHGIFVEEWVCCLNDILEHVAQKGPAIVLADSTLLHCLTCPVGPRRVANRVKELVGIKTFCGQILLPLNNLLKYKLILLESDCLVNKIQKIKIKVSSA